MNKKYLNLKKFPQEVNPWCCPPYPPPDRSLKGDPKDFSWTPEMEFAFSFAKSALALVPPLVHPNSSANIFLGVDASEIV